MQVLMSDSLLNRVSTEMPTRQKLLASFVFQDRKMDFPVTAIVWNKGKIGVLSLGINDINFIAQLIKTDENIDISISDLELYLENIFGSSYNLVEHNNYSYELSFILEDTDG